ncbi:hypothetical protein AAZV13_19G058700 [Glycine max]
MKSPRKEKTLSSSNTGHQGSKKTNKAKIDDKVKLPPKPPKFQQPSKSTTSQPSKTNASKGLDDSDEDMPINSFFKPTSSAKTKQKDDKIMNLSSSQDPSQVCDGGEKENQESLVVNSSAKIVNKETIDSNIPVSTTGANNTGMVEDLEEQKDAQSHSESSPSKPLASPEPMVKENIVEVDSTLDQFFEQ